MRELNEQGRKNIIAEERETDEIANALRALPLAEPPAGLFPAVMAQVRQEQKQELPVFQLNWIDFALSLFFAVMIGLVLLLAGSLPPQALLSLRWQLHLLQLLPFNWILWPAAALAGAVCIIACIVFATGMAAGKGEA